MRFDSLYYDMTFLSWQKCVLFKLAPSCAAEAPLVSGNTPVPDAQMTASSEYDNYHGPRRARINNTAGSSCWLCSTNETNAPEPRMYIQVHAGMQVVAYNKTILKSFLLSLLYLLCYFKK